MEHAESNYIGHEPCPQCGSTDNLARYDDGHGWCFGCGHYEQGTGEKPVKKRMAKDRDLISGEVRALVKRGLTEETCRHWNYRVGTYKDRPVQIANYCDAEGKPVAQKLRFPDKDFTFIGEPKKATLYGQWLWRDGGNMLVVTEGEIDALSVSQLQQLKWPVVSVQNGAQGAAKSISAQIEWIEKFSKVVFLLDDDEPGQKAAKECAALLPPGKAFIAKIPGFKDANEALQAGKGKLVIDAIWGAKEYRPDGLLSIDDVIERAKKPVEWGLPWCFDTLTKLTYGRRWGEIYGFGAGTGIGKTDVLTQQMEYDINTLRMKVGVVYLEQDVTETTRRLAGKKAGKRFHVPDSGWTPEEYNEALETLRGNVMLYDSWGVTEWDIVKAKVRYMAVALGYRLIYLDHLTALADPSNEKESLEILMAQLAGLAKELNIIIHYVSHLSTPEGKPHEEGGRVMIKHFKGSRAIGFWSHFLFGLERDQQNEDPQKRSITTFRVLKDRYTGQATGKTFGLGYDVDTGRMFECELPSDNGKQQFDDETKGNGDY